MKTVKPKICIPIVELTRDAITNTTKEIVANAGADSAKYGFDVLEWRVDFFAGYEKEIISIIHELKEILGRYELIVTLRTTHEGGEPNGDRFDYEKLVADVIKDGVADYVDIEYMRLKEAQYASLSDFKSIGKTKVILSYHDFNKVDSCKEIEDILEGEVKAGADICKYAAMPAGDEKEAHEDVFRLLEVTSRLKEKYPDKHFVTMAMGEAGKLSRIYGGLYGSEMSFAARNKASAPGQIDIEKINSLFENIYSERKEKHIALIGFMGAGKSSVSRALSRAMKLPEYDTDAMIVKNENMEISDIFGEKGEMYFRDVETYLLNDLKQMERGIVSCGGGMAIRDINIKMLRRIAHVVLLSAKPETIFERVRYSTHRPLLNGHMNVEYIEELMNARIPYYEKCATLVVETDGKTIDEIVNEIQKKVQTR